MTRKKIFWFSILSGAIILSPTLWYSNAFDQGVFSAQSWNWLQFNEKPLIGFPGLHFIYAAAFKLFGFSMLSIRILDYLFQLTNLALIFSLAYFISESAGAGLLSAILYSIYYVGLSSGQSAEPDGFAFTFLLFSAYFYLIFLRKRQWVGIIMVGLSIGAAFTLKPTFGLAGLVFFAFYWLHSRRDRISPPKIIGREFLLTASSLFPAMVILFIYYRWGCLEKLYQSTWLLNKDVYIPFLGSTSVFSTVRYWDFTLYNMFSTGQLLWIGTLIFLSLIPAAQPGPRPKTEIQWLLISLLVISALSMLFQAKGLAYHRIPMAGFACIFAGIGYLKLAELIEKIKINLLTKLTKYLFLAAIIVLSFFSWDMRVVRFIRGYAYRPLHYVYENANPEYQLANYIKQNTGPEDYVLSWGNLVSINFLAERKSPTQYFGYILLLGKPGPFNPMIKRWQGEFMEEIKRRPPAYFLLEDNPCEGYGNLETLKLIEGLDEFFRSNYELEKDSGTVKLFRLKK